jgi:hypothetical protein
MHVPAITIKSYANYWVPYNACYTQLQSTSFWHQIMICSVCFVENTAITIWSNENMTGVSAEIKEKLNIC